VEGAAVSLERADRVGGAAELPEAAPPAAGAAGFACPTVVGVVDESVPVGELVVVAGDESIVVVGEPEPVSPPSTLPTLVPPCWLLSTGPPASSSTPVTASRPTRKISAVAPASSGSLVRRGGRMGATGVAGRAPAAGRWAGITCVTSAGSTWVTSVVRPLGNRTRDTTTWRVRSSDRSYATAATAETTDPTAAPTTVPSAPKTDPATALVAAAPAPAMTLLTVRPAFGAAAGDGGGGGAFRNDEGMTPPLSGHARDGVSQACVELCRRR
jgi:hypothetical protein